LDRRLVIGNMPERPTPRPAGGLPIRETADCESRPPDIGAFDS
jgi:hypothetical protein